MSDVTITYKGANIATMDATGSKTLQTAGTYCEGDIGVEYVKPGGGGPVSVPAKEVNFRDYDGTVVYAYTPAEFAALSAMPANPDHSGDEIPLTAQGWNWSFADAQAYVAKYGRLEVGQMYVPTDGKTHVLIHLEQGRTSPMLGCCPSGTVDVDWGDGTAHDTLTGTSTSTVKWTPTHNYAAPGDYDIKLTCTGMMGFYGSTSTDVYSGLLKYSSGTDKRNRAYQASIQAVYCAHSVVMFGDGALFNCMGMSSITIPNSVVSMGGSAIRGCNHLSNINIPNRVSSLGENMFTGNSSLRTITIPNSVTSFGNSIFSNCNNLESITIPDSVTSIGTNAIYNCHNMHNFSLPDSLASISNNMIYQCYRMTIIDVPASVTSIGTQAMAYNVGLAELHFHRATPPTVASSNAFNYLSIDCKIYVPTGSLAAYKSATNYPSSSIYTYIEE